MLDVKQLLGEWSCKYTLLWDINERGLKLIGRIHQISWCESFKLQHVYREFNSDADATANEAIELAMRQSVNAVMQIMINDNWDPSGLAQPLSHVLFG